MHLWHAPKWIACFVCKHPTQLFQLHKGTPRPKTPHREKAELKLQFVLWVLNYNPWPKHYRIKQPKNMPKRPYTYYNQYYLKQDRKHDITSILACREVSPFEFLVRSHKLSLEWTYCTLHCIHSNWCSQRLFQSIRCELHLVHDALGNLV